MQTFGRPRKRKKREVEDGAAHQEEERTQRMCCCVSPSSCGPLYIVGSTNPSTKAAKRRWPRRRGGGQSGPASSDTPNPKPSRSARAQGPMVTSFPLSNKRGRIWMMMLAAVTTRTRLRLQKQSVEHREACFLSTRVTRGLYQTLGELCVNGLSSYHSSGNLQNNINLFCAINLTKWFSSTRCV
jgi:hypothetical protein